MTDIVSPDDLTLGIVKSYLRVDHNLDDLEINLYLASAKSYVRKSINITSEEIMDVDLCIPILNLTAHFYEQKSSTNLTNEKIDEIFSAILSINRNGIL